MIDEKKLIKNLQIFVNFERDKSQESAEAGIDDMAVCYGHGEYCYNNVINTIKEQPKIGEWIPCADGQNMPPEHDSIFAKFKGTNKWQRGMFEKSSDNVNVTVEFEDGKRRTETLHTIDGEWDKFARAVKFKVIAWRPLPEPYNE